MREPSPGAPSPRGSNSSLTNGSVTKNIGFQQINSSEHLPWSSQAVALSGNCNSNLTSEGQSPLVRSSSNASALTSLCADLSLSDSHFFEVLYIGKVRISQRKVPDTLIDDALNKFAQHEAEKAKNARRHSLLSSTGTSVYSNESTENLNEKKTDELKKCSLTHTSTTPLEPKKSWLSIENLQNSEKKVETNEIEDEFDMFSKERLEKNTAKAQSDKETGVLFNVHTKNNLHTLKEEKIEDATSMSDAGSSVTQFSQLNLKKEVKDATVVSKTVDQKENQPKISQINKQKQTLIDISRTESQEQMKSDTSSVEDKTVDLQSEKKHRVDSPAPVLSFDEISRKPKVFLKNKSGLDGVKGALPENKPFLRDRSASIGTLNLKTPIAQLLGEQNRTMLFQVGRSELRLISPDRKQILLHRAFKDVASCVLGRVNKDHFGFVCRETNETYACYVFKCESDSVATEVVNAIKQAFVAHAELLKKSREKSPNMTCEHCPMLWYHRLCHDIEGMNEKKTHAFILRRIEQLPDEEQDLIVTKYQGGTNHMYETGEHNAFLMMLLRAHCEGKQQRHVHDTAENRSEFLNQYLGGSTIFMKAKRSLSSGFDHLLKRKASQVEALAKKEPSPLPTPTTPVLETSSEPSAPELLTPDFSRSKSMSPAAPPNNGGEECEEVKESTPVNSPMMDIFLKVSDSRPAVTENDDSDTTWRQAIYEKVVQPTEGQEGELTPKNLLGIPSAPPGKRSKEQLRQLWKLAIDQTILLVRMERENARLRESEESSAVRRIKLEYTELGYCDTGVTQMWETLLTRRDSSQPVSKVDRHMLTQAVIQGVPRTSRGGVWYFLAEQASLRAAPPDVRAFPNYHTPYSALLAGLTKHQHAILIDLGRTFPQHSYFASALGPGQLALYNILKAYSLLDPDVGYCQGLSFVAGVLLLHMEEADAFVLLRHLMFRRGLRKQYLPDMSALQVQLYQLSRLLRDHEPELHAKLESLDISPALYAAPWMLTLFTSQFPLGFVVRVFDLIFLESTEVVFSVSLALLSAHKDGLMLCESCEEAAEYLKHKLPDIDKGFYEKVMKKVHALDISRQLVEYAVEYAVLREEMPRLAALTEDNRRLVNGARKMGEELDSAMDAITNYQNQQSRLELNNKSMEQNLTLLCRYISAYHKQDMPTEIKKIVQNYSKKLSFGHKITSFSSKFTSNDEDEVRSKSGVVSSPNLFAKISREEVMNAMNKDKKSPDNERKGFLMKKSLSIHSGLIGSKYPPKVLEETESELWRDDCVKTEVLTESLKELRKKSFATSHEQIHEERMFERKLKQDFDENLKRFDHGLKPQSHTDDINMFQGRKSMSLNITPTKPDKKQDSGFVTPLTPNEDKKDDNVSIISHPLSDCDVDIKFDGQSTKLKQIRPMKSFSTINAKQV